MKAKTTPAATKQPPVHEVDHALARHRIVTFRNGIPERSDWFPFSDLASFKGLLAMTSERAGLPQGIFRAVAVAHEVL